MLVRFKDGGILGVIKVQSKKNNGERSLRLLVTFMPVNYCSVGENCDVTVIKINGLIWHPFSFALSLTRDAT
jgi:hypothetical protein